MGGHSWMPRNPCDSPGGDKAFPHPCPSTPMTLRQFLGLIEETWALSLTDLPHRTESLQEPGPGEGSRR